MSYSLNFISDDDLYHHVRETILKYRFKINFESLNKNVLDPIKLTFDSAIYYGDYHNQSFNNIINNEIQRQIDKSNTNHIGYFHQNIFNYIGKENGWCVPKKGFDIENSQRKIYVEMKNKHNTMNSSSAAKTYLRMQNKILNQQDSLCLLVEVLAKKSQNIIWSCCVDQQQLSHPSIRRISIDHFYYLVTEDKNAFSKLCEILPKVILDVLNNEKSKIIENTVFEEIELNKLDPILHHLYLITFKDYYGFDAFKWNIK